MELRFGDAPYGMFWYRGIVYSKFSDTQAVQVSTGRVVDFSSDEIITKY